MSSDLCPVCESGYLAEDMDTREVTFMKYSRSVPYYYSVCVSCQSETATPEQVGLNKKIMVSFRESIIRGNMK